MKRSAKKDNRGFTLIELLITVAILAVIMVPLMHSFMTTARTNLKSRRILEATTAGQNMFEEIKATPIEEFLPSPTVTDATYVDAEGNTQYVVDEKGERIKVYSGAFDRLIDGHPYHLEVVFDPAVYSTTNGKPKVDSDYNSALWTNMSNLSKTNNAFLIMKANEATSVAAEFAMQLPPGATVNEVDIRKDMKRDITINVSHNDTTGLSTVIASVRYAYTYGAKTYEYLAMDRQELYNNGTELGNVLSGIFICYYPLYNNSVGNPTETVTINNTGNYPVEVYLVKQNATGVIPNTGYGLKMVVAEDGEALKNNNGGESVTTVVTNLEDTELALVNEKDVTPVNLWTGADGLKKGKAENRLYRVTLRIYNQNEGGSYGEDDLLATLEGTKTE